MKDDTGRQTIKRSDNDPQAWAMPRRQKRDLDAPILHVGNDRPVAKRGGQRTGLLPQRIREDAGDALLARAELRQKQADLDSVVELAVPVRKPQPKTSRNLDPTHGCPP